MELTGDYALLQGEGSDDKLKNAIEIIGELEKEVFRLRAESKRSQGQIKKLTDELSANGHNQHNTSSQFFMPSEFKKHWELLTQERLIDLFSPYFKSYKSLAALVQTLIKLVILEADDQIRCKISEVLTVIGCEGSYRETVSKYMLRLFQDHHLSAFALKDIEKLKVKYVESVSEGLKSYGKLIAASEDFEEFVREMFRLAVHMSLNDPKLEMKMPESVEVSVVDRPEDFYCIDGFAKKMAEVVVIVPGVMRNNQLYAGVKPAVVVVSDENSGDLVAEPIAERRGNEIIEETNVGKVKEMSQSQALDLYIRFKKNITKNKLEDNQDMYPPLQKPVKISEQLKLQNLSSVKSSYLSKSPTSSKSLRLHTGLRGKTSSSFIEVGQKSNKTMTSLLTKRLAEAAKKMDRRAFIKNKHIDKDSCKVI